MNTSALLIAGLLLVGVVYVAYDETLTPAQQTNLCVDDASVSLNTESSDPSVTSSNLNSLTDCSMIPAEAFLLQPDANPTRVEPSHQMPPKAVAISPLSFTGSEVDPSSHPVTASSAADDPATAPITQRNCLFDNCN